MVVDRTKIERLGEEPEEARSEEVNGMPDAGAEWRKERKSEIWERVELTPISVQRYLEELIELSKELSQGAAVDPDAIKE